MKRILNAIIAALVVIIVVLLAMPTTTTQKDNIIEETSVIEGKKYYTREIKTISACGTYSPFSKEYEEMADKAVEKMLEEKAEREEAARIAREEAERKAAEEKARQEREAKQAAQREAVGNDSVYNNAVAWLGTPGMCETVSINFVKAYTGNTVITDVNTYDVSYGEAQAYDMVVYSYGHQGVYLGGDLFLNPNNNGTTTISNIWDFGTPTFKRYNGEYAGSIACLDATMVGYGYQSIAGTGGCSSVSVGPWFLYVDGIGWTNETAYTG